MTTENNIHRDSRLAKLRTLQEQGYNPYPYRFVPDAFAAGLQEKYKELPPGADTQDPAQGGNNAGTPDGNPTADNSQTGNGSGQNAAASGAHAAKTGDADGRSAAAAGVMAMIALAGIAAALRQRRKG